MGVDLVSNRAAATEGSDEDSITVPLGNVGDRVTFRVSNRGPDGESKVTNRTIHVENVRNAPGRDGAMHDAIYVEWKESDWKWETQDATGLQKALEDYHWHVAYLLANRSLIMGVETPQGPEA